jgi:predicted transcriptional regulator
MNILLPKSLSIRLDRSTDEALARLAEASERRKSDLMREAIRTFARFYSNRAADLRKTA